MNMPTAALDADPDLEPDPLFVASFREARWILLMWVSCFVWTLTVCLNFGYPETVDPQSFPTVLGIPAWVAWGIAFPWLIANVVTIWFCLCVMEDADLGDDVGAAEAAPAADSAAAPAAGDSDV
ncbi:MAG: hypothetical protein GY758_05915 [Fuerstiella sp.]|nr:hypothetical protein [Fuerstiella sp.]MCP4513077.1 hypothetical protein [Fuerstiella sp.]